LFGGSFGVFGAGSAAAGVAGALGTAGLGLGLSELARPKMPNINIPPPPGATMIDPAGQQAAANARARAAAAGGLQSTITGAGNAGPVGATSGSKSLLGA
jgi:hypothetical protein